MQTFLPFPNFVKSVQVLDKRRCWQQVREAKAILSILRNPNPKGYKNHPAVRQWRGYENCLSLYHDMFLTWCLVHHKINTNTTLIGGPTQKPHLTDFYPPWYGYEPYHSSHRARLLEKDPEFYGKYGWKEEPGPYIWPVDKSGQLLPEIVEWKSRK